VREGRLWARCGVSSEVAPLRAVLLSWPSDALGRVDDLDASLLLEAVDVERMRAQAGAIAGAYEAAGVTVHWDRPVEAPPNYVFMRDTFFMCPEGAVVSRMAAPARAGEERLAASALARLGVPVLMTMRGEATFEGADALWLDARTVLVGVGRRTNFEACQSLASILQGMGVSCVPVEVPAGSQHLLGVVSFIDSDLAALRADRLSDTLLQLLRSRGIEPLVLPATDEITRGLAMNFVTLTPRHVLMPAGAPDTRRLLEGAGVRCDAVDIGEYLKAAGGLGCLTGILHRDSP